MPSSATIRRQLLAKSPHIWKPAVLAFAGAALLGGGMTSCDKAAAVQSKNSAAQPAGVSAVLPKEISFNEHIQPILSENCYHCHGPDSGTRKPKDAPLRLDREEDAFAKRDNDMPVIVK